jgi:SRSO17 transposase
MMSVSADHPPLQAGPASLPELASFLEPFAKHFRRAANRRVLERYLVGLLVEVPHKDCSRLAAVIEGVTGQNFQDFLTSTPWDFEAVNQERVSQLMTSVHFGPGVLIFDDTGFVKQGKHSVGVERQYSGTLGKVGNCQVVVGCHYADDKANWPVNARLYLPESWANDPDRRFEAQIPAEVVFQTKIEIALALLDQALAWGVGHEAVTADSGYGDNPAFQEGLEARQELYVVEVAKDFGVRLPEEVARAAAVPLPAGPHRGRPRTHPHASQVAVRHTVEAVTGSLSEKEWQTIAWREGSKGELQAQFAAVRVQRAVEDRTGPEYWLIGQRPGPNQEGDRKWFVSNYPVDTPLERMVEVGHYRWPIELYYKDGKALGLDDYQGRFWRGLHRHLALVMLIASWLAIERLAKMNSPEASGEALAIEDPAESLCPGASLAVGASAAEARNVSSPEAPLADEGHRCEQSAAEATNPSSPEAATSSASGAEGAFPPSGGNSEASEQACSHSQAHPPSGAPPSTQPAVLGPGNLAGRLWPDRSIPPGSHTLSHSRTLVNRMTAG